MEFGSKVQSNHCDTFCPDVVNIVNLVTLNSPTRSPLEVTNYNNGNTSEKEEVNLSDSVSDRLSNVEKCPIFFKRSIIIKDAVKGSGVVVWEREDYLAEAKKQLGNKKVFQELRGDVEGPLKKIIKKVIRKVRNRGDSSHETLDYFSVNNLKLGRFYLLPKIHKRLHNLPGRPVTSNSGFYTEDICSFMSIILSHLPKMLKILKLLSLPPLPDDVILCTIDVLGLYLNLPHDEGLLAMEKALNLRKDKKIPTEPLTELAECVLKNNIFEHNLSFYKQLRGTEIGTKMAPLYAIIFFGNLEESFFSDYNISPLVWWQCISNIFMLWQNGEKKKFLEILNSYHPFIKFTANYSREKISFLDVEVMKKRNELVIDLCLKSSDTHQYLHASSCHVFHSKNPYLIAKP